MRTGTWDMVVLGGGVAGLAAARTARRLDAQVLLVDDGASGHAPYAAGTALIAAAHAAHTVATADRFGLRCGEPRVNDVALLAAVRAAARVEAGQLRDGTIVDGLYVLDGRAEFTGPDSLRLTGVDAVREVRFRRAVIATGCAPAVPLIPGLADTEPLTVDDLSRLDRLPARIAVLGGGSTGCELAQALARLGVRVTLIEVADRLLPNEEPAAGAVIGERLRAEGVAVRTGQLVDRVGGGTVHLADGAVVPADRILLAVGRRPRTDRLGLTATGVRRDARGHVVVDQRLRSANHRVFAAGPVTGCAPLARAAELQGVQAAENALLGPIRRVDRIPAPRVTRTDPEVAQVGVTLEQAQRLYGDRARARWWVDGDLDRDALGERADGFCHLVVGPGGQLLGATVVSPRVGRWIGELAAAVRQGASVSELARALPGHLTYADGWPRVAGDVDDDLTAALPARLVGAWRGLRRITRPSARHSG